MSSEHLLEALLEQIARGTSLSTSTYVAIAVVSLVAGACGHGLASYFKVKGANLATREDFETLLAQLARQTEATESIRADLLNRTWLSQRQWDLKRDLYREMLLAIESCLLNIANAVNYQETADGAEGLRIGCGNERDAIRDRAQRFFADHLEGVDAIQRVKATAQIFLGDSSLAALEKFLEPGPVSTVSGDGLSLALFKSEKDRVHRLRATIIDEARTDLELPTILR